MLKKDNFLIPYLPALASGLLLTLSFPKTGLSYIAFFALIPWLISLPALTLKQSFYSGFIAGLFHFITLIYWIIPTIHIYGGLHLILAGSTLVLLCFYLALYPAVFAFLLKKLTPGATPFLAACLWTGLEYIRTYAFTGFSWGSLGYSQYKNLLLIQIADFSGVYGVSFVIMMVNYAVYRALKKSFREIVIAGMILIAVVGYGVMREKGRGYGNSVKVSVIQGNIPQELKWDPDAQDMIIEKYLALTKMSALDNPDLVIWPETSFPGFFETDKKMTDKVLDLAKEIRIPILIGANTEGPSPFPLPSGERVRVRGYFNSAILISSHGKVI